jgi:hypothetical protein
VAPSIDYRYFTDPEGRGERMLITGARAARRVAQQEPCASHLVRVVFPGEDVQSDEALSEALRATHQTLYHVSCTCKMRSGQQPSTTTNGLFGELDSRRARALMDVVGDRNGPLLQLRSVGGAVNNVDRDATAYAHRHQSVLATVTTFPPGGGDELDRAWSRAAHLTDGAYSNIESRPSKRSLARAFPGATGRRLSELRSRFDPDGVLGPELS